jgi:predicted dienelactone hydrolase
MRVKIPGWAVLIVSLGAFPATAKPGTLLPPTGPYGVGRVIFHWRDAARPEVLSPRTTDKRELGVWIWYPAMTDPGRPTVSYIDQLDAIAKSLPKDQVSLARSIHTHAGLNAPAVNAARLFPILILSPGSGSLPALYTTFCEDLASYGYVVAAIDHPYDDVAVALADGRIVTQAKEPAGGEELLQYQRKRVDVRVQDVRFVLDQLASMHDGSIGSPLKGRLDLTAVGTFGHSVGGMTAAEACMKEQRLKACANLDGVVSALPAYPDSDGKGPSQPFLFLEKPLPAMRGERPDDARRRIDSLRERGNGVLDNVRSGHSYRITIDGATHATFSDEEIISDANADRSRDMVNRIRTYLRSFFDESLGSKPGTVLTPQDAAVHIQVFNPR